MITAHNFEKLIDEVIAKRGFFVIGIPEGSIARFEKGDILNQVMQFELKTDFQVIGTCGQRQWIEQNDTIAELRPKWMRLPDGKGAAFYKIRKLAQ